MTAHGRPNNNLNRVVVALVLFLCSFLAHAITPEPALSWLAAQRQADGSYSALADESTPAQASLEVLKAQQALGNGADPSRQATIEYLASLPGTSTSLLATRILAAKLKNQVDQTFTDDLLSRLNADGGIGAWPGEESSLVDTLDGLEALNAAGYSDPRILQKLLLYVVGHQLPDGSFAVNAVTPPSIYLTARAALLLQAHQLKFDVSRPLQAALAYLLTRQQSAGGWGAAWESAWALLAVIPSTTDAAVYAPAYERLMSMQQPGGAWDASTYATALALRVYALGVNPPPRPTTVTLTGYVMDGKTRGPLAGASVTLADGSAAGMTTAEGRFVVSGLAPGTYVVRISHTNYVDVNQEVAATSPGEIDLGVVVLRQQAATGRIYGKVTSAASGAAVADALVVVAGATSAELRTGSSGEYALFAPAGAISISVAATGFEPLSANVELVADSVLNFSPALRVVGAPSESTLTVSGRIVDGVDGFALAGAAVSVIGIDRTEITASDGRFRIAGVAPGQITLRIEGSGYQGALLQVIAPTAGLYELGDVALVRNEIPLTTTLRGTVIDAKTRAGIVGATLQVGSRTALSGAGGGFLLTGVEELVISATVSAPGYESVNRQITLSRHGDYQFTIELNPSLASSLEIRTFVPTNTSWPAHSQVSAAAALANVSGGSLDLFLRVRVLDSAGAEYEQFIVYPEPSELTPILTLAPQSVSTVQIIWANRHAPPGQYRLLLEAFTQSTGAMLAQRQAVVEVTETARLASLHLYADPVAVNQGTTAAVRVLAGAENRSNVPIVARFSFSLRAPDGTVLHQGSGDIELGTQALQRTVEIAVFDQLFATAGHYSLKFDSVTGVQPESAKEGGIDAAPDLRIEVQQSLTPDMVAPEGEPRVRVRIRIEGVQAQ